MTIEITIPSMGESLADAFLARWLVTVGETVKRDQELCEIETDKTNVMLPSPEGGVVSQLLVPAGTRVNVGQIVAKLMILEDTVVLRSGSNGAVDTIAPAAPPSLAPPPDSAPARAVREPLLPSVRRLVEEQGIDPSAVLPTGPGGRIVKGDVLAHLETTSRIALPDKGISSEAAHPTAQQAQPAAALTEGLPAVTASLAAPPSPNPGPRTRPDEDRIERVRMNRLRRTVAERLVMAQHTAAMLTTFNEVDMSAIYELRKRYGEIFQKKHGIKLGFMGFFVKACIEALKAFPGVNAELEGEDILYKHYYDIGVAVGGGRGLVVPVVRNADHLSFSEVEKTIAALGQKARDNKLQPDDLTGGTFTISNGGIYGSMMSTPILNWPQTGILGMHNIVERPMAVEGQVVIRPMMYLALSYDHRVIDGREAVGFLVRVKECIERPERILLET